MMANIHTHGGMVRGVICNISHVESIRFKGCITYSYMYK